ncbi:I78 family peptidase inhibitor [Rhizobium sp. 1399]|uniref:I78 family peptidase inhibitor n=1 Tax=Rhizobium sp. 1399 TaxID=2817758 RepID=UPI00286D1364|nr:I78 family peptidase inhibitor [Rhizobium sp. 1399]
MCHRTKEAKVMRSTLRITPILVFLSTIPALVACSAGSEIPRGRCDPVAARALVGQPKPTDKEAGQQTGATVVRQIAPGQPVTHDFRDNRVTLETDPTSGRVVGATCG